MRAHNLGFPRIGIRRGMKKAVEDYWAGKISLSQLEQVGHDLQSENWALQADAGLDLIPVGDFSWYDHVLDMSVLLGVVPERFHSEQMKDEVDMNTYFCMARGQAPNGQEAHACEMTKWFNTNYHYIVPEFIAAQTFKISNERLFNAVDTAKQQGYRVKPVILGPISYLWLGKAKGSAFDKLSLLPRLIMAYESIFTRLSQQSVEWVQIDEPILGLDLPAEWQAAFQVCYEKLNCSGVKTLLTTYFSDLADHLALACQLPVSGLHLDVVSAPSQLSAALDLLPSDKVLSVGIVEGRNIWRTDLTKALSVLKVVQEKLGDRLWIAPSCSLLHVPVDLDAEHQLDPELKLWLAFAKQKVQEVVLLTKAMRSGVQSVERALSENQATVTSRSQSLRIHNEQVKQRVQQLSNDADKRQHVYRERAVQQKAALKLPEFPTTTIGSFPQTHEIRHIRRDFKSGKIDEASYEQQIKAQIAEVVKRQEEMDLDVLVHGEAERNDMVEYFGELLEGFAFTQNGWVQSYGSRCVKPPIIFGDVSRSKPMTVAWSQYAQSLTSRLMKGMLTGPVTILAWSFVRDDQPESATALQIALALRDEVIDLERAGIKVIQIDEPAFRELLPLRQVDRAHYLDWATQSFRIASSGVSDQTQIHTHMCYSEFNDMIEAIAALDADVITLESSRSDMELLQAFEHFAYPNEIGPGVYDIHSPRIPSREEILDLLKKALRFIPKERLWVNPDCGLKTRGWKEVTIALQNMVAVARELRESNVG